ncbi:hypothetical protein [Arthrobacter sp. Leaf69]|uniref:hypothetical protein n=1 Tax=Arthrobacter sp. Leaf69 TaxID=1736232 RepID=UPI0006FC343A|nr:hypothetical protein [Arthrobacter sp. Leaf69]KQN87354.1 hypothetical protein ASE96_11815 [Arthrobacter sp. Leaf69]
MNLRSITPAALLLATTLALAGCGTTSAAGGSSSPASGESLAASPSATPTPTPTPTPKAYAAKELAAIIAGLKDAAGRPLTAVPASELDQGIESAGEMMDAAKITPAECGALADSSAQIPEGSTYAAGGAESAKEETITVLTLVAVTDPELLSSNVEASEANSTKCANFTLEFQGQKITNTTKVLDVKTTGDNSFSSLSTQTLPSGQAVTTVMVMGLKGTLSATAVVTGIGLTADASVDLARLVDEALAKG